SDPATWNMDPQLLRETLAARAARNRLPRAVVVVHLYGQPADLGPILDACAPYDVPVLEDAAEALGTQYQGRQVGSFGHVGTFSFNGNKIITTTGGGMLVARDAGWVCRARFWATQARDPGIESRPVRHPMHWPSLYASADRVGGGVAADLCRRGICLPSSSTLGADAQRRVSAALRRARAR